MDYGNPAHFSKWCGNKNVFETTKKRHKTNASDKQNERTLTIKCMTEYRKCIMIEVKSISVLILFQSFLLFCVRCGLWSSYISGRAIANFNAGIKDNFIISGKIYENIK